jgi:tRNA threonylcarbamoyl adenosine modification protein YeaZ
MKILALELSSSQRSVAVVERNARWEATAADSNSRAVEALGLVERALCEARLEREQIDCLAVGLGPGSYTGIRLAIALAQGWQLGRQTRLVGVSSADCVAAQAQAEGMTGRVDVVIDAQRGEFYVAGYELSSGGWREVERLHLSEAAEVRAWEQAGHQLIGPEVDRWFAAARPVFPRAAILGQLALSRTEFVSGDKLEPIYLREPQFVKAPPARIVLEG